MCRAGMRNIGEASEKQTRLGLTLRVDVQQHVVDIPALLIVRQL